MLRDPVIWLWGLSVGLLLGTVLGVVFATRHHRRYEQRGLGGSVTDWGQSLALVYELRREIRRLSQANERLQADRTELWTCPGLVDTWVKLPPRPVRAVARTLAD